MAGVALTEVQSQIALINKYGETAISAATDALSTLAELEFDSPYPTIYGVPSITTFIPAVPPTIGPLSVGAPPSISTINFPAIPDKPTIDQVTLGAILAISLPEVPTISFPSITLAPPVYSITQPSQWNFNINNILITDDPMVQAAIDRLAANIRDGGTGLSAAVETAIWDREKEREEQTLSDSTDKVTTMWAKKGFSLPDGLLAHSLSEIQVAYENKRIDRAREIAIKQAELEQSNIFKSLELSIGLVSTLIKMLIDYETLLFQSQEATAKFANEYIDLQIKTYASKIEAYKATAQVHEMIIRAELTKVEVYRAQIEGQKLIGDVNTQTVQIYAEKLRATAILIDRYRAEVQAYSTTLEGEKAKIESNKLQMDAWAKQADVSVSRYNGDIERFKAESQVNVSVADFRSKQAEAQARVYLGTTELNVTSAEISMRSIQAQQAMAMEAAKGVAAATSALASGAMAAMSAHAGLSYSEEQTLNAVNP